MQINSDYTSIQNRNYEKTHTHHHHITECQFHEEGIKKQAGGGPSLTNSGNPSATQTSGKDNEDYINVLNSLPGKTSGKKGTSAAKGFWDALGDEGTENQKSVVTIFKENFLTGIHDAVIVMQEGFRHRITDRIPNIREKIKVSAGNAFGKFKKSKESFTALMGKQASSGREKYEAKGKNSNGQVTDEKLQEDIPMQMQPHNYLMDSYNKRGEYSQLNDNLTYQKPENASGRRPER
ncbi:MAG: hypothetical protein HDR10_05150 [Lachnospiraceae bacterium]|nr:hypothetical protein [Lachnospiraceae bacterium]